jgi:hypothetical protein
MADINKIIFLDIDGVMNNSTIDGETRRSWPGMDQPWFKPQALEILNRLVVADGWYIVISSSWRSDKITKFTWAKWLNIPAEKILGDTPWGDSGFRGLEIDMWLADAFERNLLPSNLLICILDDNSDMNDWHRDFFVQTEFRIEHDEELGGLNWEHYEKINRIVYRFNKGYIRMKSFP